MQVNSFADGLHVTSVEGLSWESYELSHIGHPQKTELFCLGFKDISILCVRVENKALRCWTALHKSSLEIQKISNGHESTGGHLGSKLWLGELKVVF